jgi:hypothetical protein
MTQTPASDVQSRVADSVDSGDVRADRVEISQGGASRVDAHSVSISQGGAGLVRAERVDVEQGGVGLVSARSISLRENSSAVAVVAGTATLGEGSNVVLLIARSARADIRPLLDWRAVAALGAVLGLAVALLRRR